MKLTSCHHEIVNSPVYKFEGIVGNLIGENLKLAKIELCRYPFKMDYTLIESIRLVMKDLEKEEGKLSDFFYEKFGIEIFKNKKRKQLIYLGAELKRQSQELDTRMKSIFKKKEELACVIVDLRRLNECFHSQNIILGSKPIKNKNEFYKMTLEKKIKELEGLEYSLMMSYHNLCEIETIYTKALETIPRKEYLKEEKLERLVA